MTKLVTRGFAVLGLAIALWGCGGAAKQGDTGTKTGASGGDGTGGGAESQSTHGAESQPSH